MDIDSMLLLQVEDIQGEEDYFAKEEYFSGKYFDKNPYLGERNDIRTNNHEQFLPA